MTLTPMQHNDKLALENEIKTDKQTLAQLSKQIANLSERRDRLLKYIGACEFQLSRYKELEQEAANANPAN